MEFAVLVFSRNYNITKILIPASKTKSFATLEKGRNQEPKCVAQLFLGSLLGRRREAVRDLKIQRRDDNEIVD